MSDPMSDPAAAAAAVESMKGILKDAWAVKYTNVAFLMLMVYDHLITLDLEKRRIWTLPWRLPKFLFLMNRYIVPPMLFFGGIIPSVYNLTPEVCAFVARWTSWPTVLAIVTIELMLILRVLALYNHNKKISIFLIVVFAVEIIAYVTLAVMILVRTKGSPGGDLFSGCLFEAPWYFYTAWVPAVIFESIIVALTIWKVYQYRSQSSTALDVLARDSLVYFLIMFGILLANVLIARFGRGFLGALLIGPSSVVACIAAARMTMNIREHTMKDVDGTEMDIQELGPMDFHPRTRTDTLTCSVYTGRGLEGSNTRTLSGRGKAYFSPHTPDASTLAFSAQSKSGKSQISSNGHYSESPQTPVNTDPGSGLVKGSYTDLSTRSRASDIIEENAEDKVLFDVEAQSPT